ncbi:MAG TPA: DedA family protein [Gammaproteobacteria bacterium]|nr:DedA family protein [Gammaproteobacteria bacterium]
MPHEFLRDYGYVTLFCVVLAESFGIPAPGQTLLIATALLAAHGELNIVAVLSAAFAGTALGGIIAYGIGQYGGRRVILRFGRYVRIGKPELRRLEDSFTRYGVWFVMVARFFEVLRQINGIVAGTVGMPLRAFVLSNFAGAALWTGVWGLGSWRLGKQMESYADVSEKAGILVMALLLGVLLVLLGVYVRHRWQRQGRRDD